MNTGHGHVYPRDDGAKAKCGGPGMCAQCSQEAAQQMRLKNQIAIWHRHLEECRQCRDNPFNLCSVGAKILTGEA